MLGMNREHKMILSCGLCTETIGLYVGNRGKVDRVMLMPCHWSVPVGRSESGKSYIESRESAARNAVGGGTRVHSKQTPEAGDNF